MRIHYLVLLLLLAYPLSAANSPIPGDRAITVDVDVTATALGIIHSHLVIPAAPGPLNLAYPRWIPGQHSPKGPINEIIDLRFSSSGKPLTWKRDDLDMYLFQLVVPDGAKAIEADLDFACSKLDDNFSVAAGATQDMAVLSWNQVLIYPADMRKNQAQFTAKLHLPANWRHGTSLPVARETEGMVEFRTVPLITLIDSPVIMGEHFKVVSLGGDKPAEMDIAAESEDALQMSAIQKNEFERLVRESSNLFGGARYERYHFLLALSDPLAGATTLEHFHSSDNRMPEHFLGDDTLFITSAGLIPHEYVHSWNGKYRVPAGLDTFNYQDPIRGSLLWVYEGLTDYVANILTARSGFWSPEQYREALALDAAEVGAHRGRTWRSLQDTAVSAPLLEYDAPAGWTSERRGADYYPESGLIWLEVDTLIRQKTSGQRSLDDFCRVFMNNDAAAGPSSPGYTFDNVVDWLNRIAPFDWRSFLLQRLNGTVPEAPLGGIEAGGWKLVYSDVEPEMLKLLERAHKLDLLWPEWDALAPVDVRYSIGLLLSEDGAVMDVDRAGVGVKAGIAPGMRIVAVNGKAFSSAILRAAIAASAQGGPLDMQIRSNGHEKKISLDYHDGERYPHLVRDPAKPDLLGEIIASHAK